MPANPQQIHAALRELGTRITQESERERSIRQDALRLLRTSAAAADRLRAAAETVVASIDPNVRCALPISEDIAQGLSCPPTEGVATVVAVDGSQIVPNRHDEVLFALINIGTVISRLNSGTAPELNVDSKLLFGDELYTADGSLISEGDVSLLRDSGERAALLRHADRAAGLSVALTDGPLELWGAKDVGDPRAYERALREYLETLRSLERAGWIVAGYVDKPGADLVMRLLEIGLAGSEDLKRLRSFHPLRGASDRWLFAQVLSAGQRSAVFLMQSSSGARYDQGLAIQFFYLNVGSAGHPVIARVEVPRWVGDDPASLAALHRLLLEQSASLGSRPYPYILHRAHETARITETETAQIRLQLLLELRRRGVEPEAPSGKSSAKAVSEIKGRY